MIELHGKAGGGYVRASRDTGAGTELEGMSVEGQEDDINVAAEELGVNVVEVYNDNNLSGSKFATKAREEWLRMLADIESGRLEVLIMWELSRGSRKYSEWGQFLDLVEEKGVPIHCVTHERTYNPRNHKDMEILQLEGVKAHSESNLISARVRRGHANARRKGRPHGKPRFGWARVYDEKTGKMLGQVPNEIERVFVEEAYAWVLGGGSLVEAAKDWAERNDLPEDDPRHVPLTRVGNRWGYESYRSMLLSPVHMGKFKDPKSGELMEGGWEGFIPEDTWWRVHNIIAGSRKPTGSRPAGAKYMLTFIARCGKCGSFMAISGRKEPQSLVCSRLNDDRTMKRTTKHLSIRLAWADEAVELEMAKRLCDRALVRALSAQDSEAAKRARAEAAKLQAELDGIFEEVKHRRGAYTAAEYGELKAAWEPEIERLLKQAKSGLDDGAALALSLLEQAERAGVPDEDLFEVMLDAFRDTPLLGRRLLVQTFTESITIMPSPAPGRKAKDLSRVVVK